MNSSSPLTPAPHALPERWSRYQLSVFDNSFERSTFITGWLVQGAIDVEALGAALGRVTQKWRVLAGRLEAVKHPKLWQIAVPLDETLPTDYPTFVLTSSIAEVPLETFIQLPLQTNTEALPQSLFLHPTTPRQNADWAARRSPLTCWHVTQFPAVGDQPAHACIGFARSHGIFDGVGAGMIMRAVAAEMAGQEWTVPPPPSEKRQENHITSVLNAKVAGGEDTGKGQCGYRALGLPGMLGLVGWHLRERYWRGASHRVFVIPQSALTPLVEGVKAEIRTQDSDLLVTTGDVLVAWLMKTIYSEGSSPETLAHCCNFASFRDLIPGRSLSDYIHNSFIPLPYPVLKVEEINALSLAEFTRRYCAARHSLNLGHVVSAHLLLSNNPICMPVHPKAQDTIVLSNVSASRILETDWSPVGSQGTICGYRFSATPNNLVIGNSVYISGRLGDGSTVIDVNVNQTRLASVAAAVNDLTQKHANTATV
ncbi:unnamed protein product [Mycena citricolor]|uniref:Uncharacterized protein n=1 Tax=Mycena citricolor TaxID=2018698 RepID=A0AAD2HHZ5_9AGAR|nr:unnamed protein product [Mycena citricolor]